MQDKFYAVLDTNVLVSALLGASRMSIPTKVLKAVTDNKIVPLYNNEIIDEYKEVLSRNKFPFSKELIYSVIKVFTTDGIFLDRTKSSDEIFPDEKGIVFMKSPYPKKVHTSSPGI